MLLWTSSEGPNVAHDGFEQLVGVREGQILDGKYRVERVLGVGGMGAVVAAHHLQLDTKVAIKFLLPAVLARREGVVRFAREARAAVRITSEHVARVFDVGTLETGAPYIVMEFLEGEDLGSRLEHIGQLPADQAVEFVLQACVAVADAHGLGIVHRDLKPSNLFCIRRSDGQFIIKVVDFGISKFTGSGDLSRDVAMTNTTALMGSPFYMSPEQMQATRDVDARTDIWSLGIILYELLAGRVPFDGDGIAEVYLKVALEAAPPLRAFRPDLPEGLESVILRCLEKDREKRYRNVAELALALLPFAPDRARDSVDRIARIIHGAGLSATAVSVAPSPERSAPAPAGTIAPLGRTHSPPRGRRRVFLGIVSPAMALTAAAVAALVLTSNRWPLSALRGSSSPPPAASASAPLPTAPPTPGDAPSVAVISSFDAAASPARTTRGGSHTNGPLRETQKATTAAPLATPPSMTTQSRAAASALLLTAKPNCDPNFTFDDQGQKHFRPECFPNPKK
jgi:serine/threonine protein kinase